VRGAYALSRAQSVSWAEHPMQALGAAAPARRTSHLAPSTSTPHVAPSTQHDPRQLPPNRAPVSSV